MNSMIRRIDLSCKLFAPVATGFIISVVSLTASAITLALWNAFSVCLQYLLLMSECNGIPSLSESSRKRALRSTTNDVGTSPSSIEETQGLTSLNDSDLHHNNGSFLRKLTQRISRVSYFGAWKGYSEQDVVLPGIALAFIYFNVLSFGTLMTAALNWEGIQAYIIGIARGISATIGIIAWVALFEEVTTFYEKNTYFGD